MHLKKSVNEAREKCDKKKKENTSTNLSFEANVYLYITVFHPEYIFFQFSFQKLFILLSF